MNRIEAVVEEIQTHQGVSLLRCRRGSEEIVMLSLELPEGLEAGREVTLGIKATHISVAPLSSPGWGIDNRIPVEIAQIEEGEIVVSVELRWDETTLEAVLTRNAFDKTGLEEEDEAFALFGAAEVALLEVKS